MKKRLIVSVFLISILVMSVMVYAAGQSTLARDSAAADGENGTADKEVPKSNNRSYRSIQDVDCEAPENRRERIKCRLGEYRKGKLNESEYDVPEACRNIGSEQSCKVLYRNLQRCYDLPGRAKDQCFKRAIGFAGANLKDENSGPKRVQKARDYVVALLYELQDRIEGANVGGQVSDDDAAGVIDLIVEIKQDILSGVSKEEIRPKFQDLKAKLRELRPDGSANE